MNRGRSIFISVAEASADMHAAALVRRAGELLPECRFHGLTGPRMLSAGVESIGDLTRHAAMLSGIAGIKSVADRFRRRIRQSWRARRPDLVVLMDSSVFHLPLAAEAKALGLSVLYYIAPQTWASRRGRNRKLARDVDLVACILPFEEEYFRRCGVTAEYVGHPLFETPRDQHGDPEVISRLRAAGLPVVALLPGSRAHVIREMLPLQLRVLGSMRSAGARITAAISCQSQDRYDQVRGLLASSGVDAHVILADNASLLSACDLALVTSGTATLTVGRYRKPMVVMYHAGNALAPLYDLIGRRVLKTPHLSLPNILAGSRIVPEFMPFVRDVEAVAQVASRLLSDEAWRSLMIHQLDETIGPLERSNASENVCGILGRLLAVRH